MNKNDKMNLIRKHLKLEEHIHVMYMSIRPIHDVLCEHYDESLSFPTRNNTPVTLYTLIEPDGLRISFYDPSFVLEISELDLMLMSGISNIEIGDDEAIVIADMLEYVYDLMCEHDINPEEYFGGS